MFGTGFTVIVKLVEFPKQPFKLGITEIVEVIGEFVVFCATKLGIAVPDPLAAKPIAVFVFVQEYVVPVGAPVKLTTEVFVLAHTV